ncbi:hypothetical protein Fuma_03916 [Fuerstiella marisgermanici]|uniref:Uncharacterized protein n=1 Tax=Fuerstiella marisgermanici TaxID=1891926 RepID=A0A1P8WJQ7_9PLAN|nr:hypothetical protein Fuma_03916 [Fuerstiella marisgermanici]
MTPVSPEWTFQPDRQYVTLTLTVTKARKNTVTVRVTVVTG